MTTTNRSRFLLLLALTLIVWTGCRDKEPLEDRNLAPETYLVQSPQFGQSGYYVNHLFWDGFDRDGRVAYFEVTITDSAGNVDEVDWYQTFRTDSLVRFPTGGADGQDQVLGSRFYVRAVDNVGRVDPTPAWIFFGAKNVKFPEVQFLVAEGSNPSWPDPANPAVISLGRNEICGTETFGFPPDTLPAGSSVRFQWRGVDRDSLLGSEIGYVTAYRYWLSPIETALDSLGGSFADTMVAYDNLAPGPYTFTVRTRDDGGLEGEGCQYFQVNFDPSARIEMVEDLCTGRMVRAYRIGTKNYETGDNPCDPGFVLQDWTPESVGLSRPADDPCLPPGYFSSSDTLAVVANEATSWWLEFEAAGADPDGQVAGLEVNFMECNPQSGSCAPRIWTCAPLDENGMTIHAGPFNSGDYRVVVAAVDDLGQRGASSADTIDVFVDLSPRLVQQTEGVRTRECDCLAAGFQDTIQVCASDSLLVATIDQSPGTSGVPCAVQSEYLNGVISPYRVYDYQSFPQPGDTLELEFGPDANGNNVAEFCVLLWMYDPDGHGNVGYIRWEIDRPISLIKAFENITNEDQAPPPGQELTPACFTITVQQDVLMADHELNVEIRDWLQQDVGALPRVAERTSKYTIPFKVIDLTKVGRRALPGRESS